ncbi:hypothetical protein KW794_00595 [Candidatus Saccharibacteria bacterium]|nr:hypothetical protein [Candidatus Saccharibacteria bacterium]
MTERDNEFWAIVENDESLQSERILQASFDERAIGVARFILFGEGKYSAMDFFTVVTDIAAEYQIDFDNAIEALDLSEARELRGLVHGET